MIGSLQASELVLLRLRGQLPTNKISIVSRALDHLILVRDLDIGDTKDTCPQFQSYLYQRVSGGIL